MEEKEMLETMIAYGKAGSGFFNLNDYNRAIDVYTRAAEIASEAYKKYGKEEWKGYVNFFNYLISLAKIELKKFSARFN